MDLIADFESLLNEAKNLGLRDSALADLAGLSATRVCRLRKGSEIPSYPEIKSIRLLLQNLAELQRRSGGLPINYTNIGVIRRFIQNIEDERENPPEPPTPADWDLIGGISSGEPLNRLAMRLSVDEREVIHRVREAKRRIDFAVSQLADQQI